MNIITISRQFGSGGRELGKKIADILGYDYYDKNILEKICENKNLSSDYVKQVLHDNDWKTYCDFSGSFANLGFNSTMQLSILSNQKAVLEEIAKLGRNCVIIGRDADIILKEYKPFRIYVCADFSFRVDRCMKREENKEGQKLTEKQVIKNIKKVDKNRVLTREILSGKNDMDPSMFDLAINSASWDFDTLAAGIAELVEKHNRND